MLNYERPDVLNPPAIVQQAVDLEKAIARLRELKEQRQKNTLETARIFADIRRAYPDVPRAGGGTQYSPQFVQAIEQAGYAKSTVMTMLWLHNNPEAVRKRGNSGLRARKSVYRRLIAVIDAGASITELRRALAEELDRESE